MDMYGKVVPGPCPVLWPMSCMGDADSDTDAGTALRGGTPSSSNATSTSTTANTRGVQWHCPHDSITIHQVTIRFNSILRCIAMHQNSTAHNKAHFSSIMRQYKQSDCIGCYVCIHSPVSLTVSSFVVIYEREGVFILKIDRMLYGFYYFTSCLVNLLCGNWRGSATARVKNRSATEW